MFAFEGKADIGDRTAKCPLLTIADIQLALADVCFRRGSGHDFLTALAANALAIFALADCDFAMMLLPEGLSISCQTAYR